MARIYDYNCAICHSDHLIRQTNKYVLCSVNQAKTYQLSEEAARGPDLNPAKHLYERAKTRGFGEGAC